MSQISSMVDEEMQNELVKRKKLKVHMPMNNTRRYTKNFYLFYDSLIHHLSNVYDVTEFRYENVLHEIPTKIHLTRANNSNFYIHDADLVVENELNEFVMFSFGDILHSHIVMEKYNSKLKKVFISQFYPPHIAANVKDDRIYREKYLPWIYIPSSIINLEPFFYKRKYMDRADLLDKMVFRGATSDRPILEYFDKRYLSDTTALVTEYDYYEDVIKHKIGLSIGGRGELCHRDVEYMAIGVPLLRFEYQTKWLADFIPNVHYISVDMPDDMPKDINRDYMPHDAQGTEHHAKLLIDRFLEVKDDVKFLQYVASNARRYYETYLSPHASVQYTTSLIEKYLGL